MAMNSLPAETPNWRKKFDAVLDNFLTDNVFSPGTKVGLEFCVLCERWEERWTFPGVKRSSLKFSDEV